MQAIKTRYYTPEEYLQLEEIAEFRSEYYKGQIRPLIAGTLNHDLIAVNLLNTLNNALEPQKHKIFVNALRLLIPSVGFYTYPDVIAIAGKLEFAPQRRDTVTNPMMIAEVLSEPTKDYDRGEKFALYRTLPSLQEYVAIDQDKIHVEQFSKTSEGKWLLSEYQDRNLVLSLTSIPLQIKISELYKKIVF